MMDETQAQKALADAIAPPKPGQLVDPPEVAWYAQRGDPPISEWPGRAVTRKDRSLPKKQRHTAKRIYERPRAEHGCDGKYTIVKDYVRERRRRTQEMYVPLSHPAGDAQCDFGQAKAVIDGVEQTVHYFVLDLPHSDACFVKAYPAETTEAFCDGHVSAFSFLGGVPRSILYDNTRLAVARILRDDRRKRTSVFSELVSHYLFEERFGRRNTRPYAARRAILWVGPESSTPRMAPARLRRPRRAPRPTLPPGPPPCQQAPLSQPRPGLGPVQTLDVLDEDAAATTRSIILPTLGVPHSGLDRNGGNLNRLLYNIGLRILVCHIHTHLFPPLSPPHAPKPESTERRLWGQSLKKPEGAPLNLGEWY